MPATKQNMHSLAPSSSTTATTQLFRLFHLSLGTFFVVEFVTLFGIQTIRHFFCPGKNKQRKEHLFIHCLLRLIQLSMSYLSRTSADANWQLINLACRGSYTSGNLPQATFTTSSVFLSWGEAPLKCRHTGRAEGYIYTAAESIAKAS